MEGEGRGRGRGRNNSNLVWEEQCSLQICGLVRCSNMLQASSATAPPQPVGDWFWSRLAIQSPKTNTGEGLGHTHGSGGLLTFAHVCQRNVTHVPRVKFPRVTSRAYLAGCVPLRSFQDLVAAVELLCAQPASGRHASTRRFDHAPDKKWRRHPP